jgi:hypothetical protein
MKKITFIFALLIVSTVMKAQQTAWVNCKGITANRSFGVKFDSSGNVIQVGSFRGTIDFNNLGPTPVDRVSNGLSDIYVAKYNPSGILLWVYTIGGTGDDIANAIAIDSNGDIVVTGAFSDSFDFNAGTNTTTLTSSGSTDAFVLKLTSAGAFSWAQRAGGVEAEGGSDIETIGTNIFVSGTYASGIVDLFSNTNSICRGVNDVFLCAFSSNGSYLWSKTMGNAFNDATGRLTAFNNKIALCFSSFGNSSISTFDYGGTAQASVTTSTGGAITTGLGRNGAVSIFDSVTGSFDKFFKFQGEEVVAVKLLVDSSNINFAVVGSFINNIDINPYAGIENIQRQRSNAFVSYFKNDTANTFLSSMTTINNNTFSDLYVGDAEIKNTTTAGVSDIYLVGSFTGNINVNLSNSIGTELSSSAQLSGYVIKYGLNASNATEKINFEYTHENANSRDINGAIAISNDIEISPIGDNDIIISGNIDSNNSGFQNSNIVSFLPSTSSITHSTANDIERGYLQYINNCIINTNVTQSGNTLTVAQTGATYQWINCTTNANVSGAVSQSYTPTVSGIYKVLVTINGCIDTSACTNITVLSNSDFEKLGIKLYPNPVKDSFTIEGEIAIEKLTIYNLLGQKIKDFSSNGTSYEVNDLSSGTYIIEVITDKGKATTRIVKE